jgi:hypothetical protein
VSPTTTRALRALLKLLLETSPVGEGRPIWDPLRRGHPTKGAGDHFGKGDVSARGIAALRRIRQCSGAASAGSTSGASTASIARRTCSTFGQPERRSRLSAGEHIGHGGVAPARTEGPQDAKPRDDRAIVISMSGGQMQRAVDGAFAPGSCRSGGDRLGRGNR